MSVKFGIYDFFSYTIPGGILVCAILFVFSKYLGLAINLSDLSFIEFLPLLILAYLLGYAGDYIARKTWYRFFFDKNLIQITIKRLNETNKAFEILHPHTDWHIAFSFVKKHNMEMAQEIEKLNVQNIMLRNSSFAVLSFVIIFGVEFFLNGYSFIYIISSLICLGLSIALMRESTKFATWYVEAIYHSLVALTISPENLPIIFSKGAKESKRTSKG